MSKEILRILVGSTNPVKRGAAEKAFSRAFPNHMVEVQTIAVPSGVADQPMNETDTKLGAQNRTLQCAKTDREQHCDFYVAMEGGVDNFSEGPVTFAYVAIRNCHGLESLGRSANLPLPPSVYARLEQGEELAHVMDDIFNEHNIRQKGGAIGVLTNHLENRQSVYTQALTLALAPFMHPELYRE
ncbi:Non-canonical purine NTP phosphatase [Marinomonas aquimarina]|uniref:Inosine/xanthosine triphosphatase n=1 Tax=Marinomonas aquimarina TaxID=295068 RepID=A0A1A8TDY4_9GAMM|nr:inosine/xanthosine triphosphatase [Marinomonas aquimarina]SBS31420.1 Non-canonical purine NTP phosphatase [Marinomonas aquimarina]